MAIVTNVGTGCGGRGSVGRVDVVAGRFCRERTQRAGRTALKRLRPNFGRHALGGSESLAEEAAYGKTVWSWHPWLVSSWRRFAALNRVMRAVNSSVMEAKGIRLQGERGIRRKPIAQGMPGCSGCTCMLVCAFLKCTLHTRPRVQQSTRHSLRPLTLWGANDLQKLGRIVSRERRHAFAVIARLDRAPSIPETAMIEPIGRGVLDPCLRRDDDGVLCCYLHVIASHPVGAKRRRMTGSAKQSIFTSCSARWIASLALAMTAEGESVVKTVCSKTSTPSIRSAMADRPLW
ncbi:hypothetical protein V1272_001894 [Bradyrhizobium sp. AZCC 1708]